MKMSAIALVNSVLVLEYQGLFHVSAGRSPLRSPVETDERSSRITEVGMLSPACIVCNEPLLLESCIVDEVGNPAHEYCYLVRLGVAKEDSETREILDFLTTSSTRSIPTICPNCGSALDQQTAKFFWAGQAWAVPLVNCPTCHLVPAENNRQPK